jgi:acetyltransferase-like isoleucine patch superfamily enzyme
MRNLFQLTGSILSRFAEKLPMFRLIRETKDTQTPILFSHWFYQRFLGNLSGVYWPVHKSSLISYPQRVYAGIETSPGYMPGCYISAMGGIYIGDYTQIAPNVGIISSNHSLYDNREFELAPVKIGKYCWIGMGAVILPGVTLGDYTIVGSGSIVTKSFPDGYQVLVGNPARVIKNLEKEKCVHHRSRHEYNGFIPAGDFPDYVKRHLKLPPELQP